MIWFLALDFFPHVGGASWVAYYLSYNLSKYTKIILIAPKTKIKTQPEIVHYSKYIRTLHSKNISIISFPKRLQIPRILFPLIQLFCIIIALRKFGRPKAIVLQYPQYHPLSMLIISILKYLLGFRLIVRIGDTIDDTTFDKGIYKTFLYMLGRSAEKFLRFSEIIFIVSSELSTTLGHREPILKDRLYVLPNGVEHSLLINKIDKIQARKELGIPYDTKILIFVGRPADPAYNLVLIINALRRIIDILPSTYLYVIGAPLTQNQIYLAKSISVNNHIIYIGPKPKYLVFKYIAIADLCIANLSDKWYPTVPTKILEYFAFGKHVLMSNYGISYDIRGYGSYIIVNPHDENEVSLKVIEYLSTPMKDNIITSLNECTWENLTSKMIKVIKQNLKE